MKVLQGLFLIFLTAVLAVVSLLAASAFKWAGELPDLSPLDALEFTATTQIFASNGELIGELVPLGGDGAPTNRLPVSLNEVSPAALAAIVASEDDQFYRHYGFDIPGIIKATYLEFSGEGGRGGSTITTQVIKNTVLSDISTERSLERKVKEVMLAIELERRLTKAEILQRYINVSFWGGNIYGIRAAAKAYFNKDPIELSLAEGLYLARLIPYPNGNHRDFVGTRKSMKVVLDNMVKQGVISQEVADRAWREPLQPTGWSVQYDAEGNIVGEPQPTGEDILLTASVSSNLAPHVTFAVRNELLERYDENVVFGSGGLRVYTTIDVQAQNAANEASLRADLPAGTQTAIVGIDPQTGGILAMVGERLVEGRRVGEFNRAMAAKRQPGSSFKPIVYATAIEQGGYTQAQVVVDEPAVFKQAGQPDWEPRNYDDSFIGPRTIREQLDQSRNIPTIKVLEALTPEAVASRARELGYENIKPYYSLGLGSFEVTPVQHASAFTAFANGGVRMTPHLIDRIEDADGNVLWQAQHRATRVWSEQTAYVILDMLRGTVVDRNPTALSWRAAIDGRWVGGKTGTSNEERDLWFVGVTPGLVAAVWVGNDDFTTITNPGGERITSSRQPIYIWRDFVENSLRGKPTGLEFARPEGITFRTVNRLTGEADPSGTSMAFVSGTESAVDGQAALQRLTITIPLDRRSNTRATADTPREFIEWTEIHPEEIADYNN